MKAYFLKLAIVEHNFYNNSCGFIIPDSCDTDIRQSFFSFCRGGAQPPLSGAMGGESPATPALDAPLSESADSPWDVSKLFFMAFSLLISELRTAVLCNKRYRIFAEFLNLSF